MDDVRKVVMNLYGEHKTCLMQVYADREEIDDIDDVFEEEIYENLEEDFRDKGFTQQEIDEILVQQMKESTFYKLGAYMIALFNQPETLDEWRESVKNDAMVEHTEEEVVKLWNAYQEVDY